MNKRAINQWFEKNQIYFSNELNGHIRLPKKVYMRVLRCAQQNLHAKTIMDFGCGNGMLLKFLMEFSDKTLEPFGIDKNKKAIIQAKKIILPKFSKNINLKSLENYKFKKTFDVIITNPLHTYPKHREFLKNCITHLNEKGILIVIIHYDSLRQFNYTNINQIKELKTLKIKTKQEIGFGIGLFQKKVK